MLNKMTYKDHLINADTSCIIS